MGTKQELVQVAEDFFERGHDKRKIRSIGEWRQEAHAEMMEMLPDGKAVNKCATAELCRTLLDRMIADDKQLQKLTLMDPVLFFYAVAMVEEIFGRERGTLLFEDDAERSRDPGRRARLLPRHIVLLYLWYAKTNASQDTIAIQMGIGQKTASRYIAIAKDVLSRTLPTPRKYDEHIQRQTEMREMKKYLPGPGRGTCIEDGRLNRMQRPGQRGPRDRSYSGRRKACMGNTLGRFNARGEMISVSPTDRGTCNDVTMARKYRLNLGIATQYLHDPHAAPKDRVHRIDDTGFGGIETEEPGAVYERTVGYKAYQKLDDEGKARHRVIAISRLPSEWFFGRISRYARMRDPYAGTYSEYGDEHNVVCGLVNLHLMGGGVRKGSDHPKKPEFGRQRRHRRDMEADEAAIDRVAVDSRRLVENDGFIAS